MYCRQVLFRLNAKRVIATSTARSKIDVKSDRSEPFIDVLFSEYRQNLYDFQDPVVQN